jgi:hypothetical protein
MDHLLRRAAVAAAVRIRESPAVVELHRSCGGSRRSVSCSRTNGWWYSRDGWVGGWLAAAADAARSGFSGGVVVELAGTNDPADVALLVAAPDGCTTG